MESLSIAMVCPSVKIPENVAQSIHQWEFARNLAEMGHKVHLFCQLGPLDNGEWHIDGVEYHPVYSPNIPYRRVVFTASSKRTLGRFLLHNSVDVIHDRGYLFGGSGIKNALRYKIPSLLQIDDNWLITEAQSSFIAKTKPYMYMGRRWIKWALSRASASFTVSHTLKSMIIKDIGGIGKERIYVVPNGVDPNKFTPNQKGYGLRNKYGINGHIVMFVGALGPWHGVNNLLNAAPRVLEANKDVWFVIVGGRRRDEIEVFKQRTGALNISHRVVFTGQIPKEYIPKVLVEADVCVAPYPPVDFGFSPFKIFEYMATEKAVVASDLPSIREIIDHGRDGYLTEAWNPSALANAIIMLLEDKNTRATMGKRARAKILSEFTWRKATERLVELYRKVVS